MAMNNILGLFAHSPLKPLMYVMIVALNFRAGKGSVQPVKRGIRLVKCG